MPQGSLILAMMTLGTGVLLPWVILMNSSADTPVPLMIASTIAVLATGASVSEFRAHRRLHWLVVATLMVCFAALMMRLAVTHAFLGP